MRPRTFVAAGAVIGVLAVCTVVLGIHAAGEDSRTAESVCRSALLKLSAGESAYVVQGDVKFGHGDATALTCLVVLDGGKANAAPLFATAFE